MTTKTTKALRFRIEIETMAPTRQWLAHTIAPAIGRSVCLYSDAAGNYRARDGLRGRVWRVIGDRSLSNAEYRCVIVSPILGCDDLELLFGMVGVLALAGAQPISTAISTGEALKRTSAAPKHAVVAHKPVASAPGREPKPCQGLDLAAHTREPEARTLVFTYGTLLSGEPNHRVLGQARLVGEDRTQRGFTLHNLGYCPSLVQVGEQAVAGEVYEVDEPTLAALDRFEGHPHFYRRTSIVLESGTSVQAYLMTPVQVLGRPVISSGAWKTRDDNRASS